ASATAAEIDRRSTPGIVAIDSRPPGDESTSPRNSGSTSRPALNSVSRTSPRSPAVARSLRMRVAGKAICPQVRAWRPRWSAGALPGALSFEASQPEARERSKEERQDAQMQQRDADRRRGAVDSRVERLQRGLEGKHERDRIDDRFHSRRDRPGWD